MENLKWKMENLLPYAAGMTSEPNLFRPILSVSVL